MYKDAQTPLSGQPPRLLTCRRMSEIAAKKAAAKGKAKAELAEEDDAPVDQFSALWRLLRDAVWKVRHNASLVQLQLASYVLCGGISMMCCTSLRPQPPLRLASRSQHHSKQPSNFAAQVLAPEAVLAVALLPGLVLREATGLADRAARLHTAPNSLRKSIAQVLAPEAVLAVVLLTGLELREAFGPSDLVRWALAGSLPHLALPHVAAPALLAAPHEFPLQLVQPQGALSPEIQQTAALLFHEPCIANTLLMYASV